MHNGKKPPLGEEKSVTDTAAAISFLNVLFEHCVGPPNLCVLLNSDLGREAGKMITTRSETKLKNFIRQHDQPRWGSYFCVATMRSEEHHHSKDGISETPALHADIDFKDLAIDTRDDVIRKLKALRKPPSILVDSGNGIHAYWRFKKRDQRQSDVQPPVFYVRQPIIYAANRENGIARVEAALKLLCDLVGGDTKVTHPAAVMRLPGTHNSKFSEWKQVAVIEQNNNEYDLEELEEWLAETSPIILRKVRPQAKTAGQNNFSNYGDSHSYKPPIDVEERLANMMYMGEGDSAIHTTQVSVSASLLSAGVHPKEVVKILMAATEAAAGDYWKRWNKRHEERNIEKMCETWLEKLGKEEKRKKEKREEPDEGTSTPPDPIEMFWHGELDERPPVSWLVDKLVPEKGIGLASGQWGSAKTFIMFDLSGSIASGLPFAGRDVVRPGGVLFVAAEGGDEVRTRLKGLDQKLSGDAFVAAAAGNAIEADVNHLPLVWCEEPIRFNTPDGHKKLLHIAEEVHKHMLDKFGVPLVLIIFDTMGASVDFKDANATEENQHVMNRLNAISRVTNTFVLVVDHFGKNVDVGTKNSGTKEDNADLVLAMLCDRDVGGSISNTRMKIRKLRRGKSGTEFPFDLTVVDIGDGETTCSISWKKERSDSAHTSSKSWTKTLQVFRTVMEVMTLDRSAEMRPYGSEGPIVKAVELSVARTEFMLAYPSDAEDQRAREAAKRSAFNRALKDARNRMLICSRDIDGKDYLWLMNEEVTDYLRKKGA